MKKLLVFLCVLTLLVGVPGVASATLINGGFESGTLAGWSSNANSKVVTYFTEDDLGGGLIYGGTPLLYPHDGDYFAQLETGEVPIPDPAVNGKYSDLGNETKISQQITLNVGDTLSGMAAFFSLEPAVAPVFNDAAYVDISGTFGTERVWSKDVSNTTVANGDTEYYNPYSGDFIFRASDWSAWEWEALAVGDYTLTFGIVNAENYYNGTMSYVESFGFFDYNVHTPIPEPATMFLLASGLGGLAGLRRKLKK